MPDLSVPFSLDCSRCEQIVSPTRADTRPVSPDLHARTPAMSDKYAPAEGAPKHQRRMSLVTETLARGVVEGTAFPPAAKCPDFPLATFFYLDAAPSDEDLLATMRKIVAFDRLKSRVVGAKKKHQYRWEEIPDIEKTLMSHVTRKEVSSEAELRAEMDAALVAPLDVEKPLWDVIVLTLKPGATWTPSKGGPVAPPPVVCVRVSHAVGDGLSLVNVLTRLTDGDASLLDFKRRPSGGGKTSAMQYLTSPSKLWALLVWLFNCVVAVLSAIGTPVGRRDSHTAFYDATKPVAYSGKRRMVTCEGFKLADLKVAKEKFGCTVNDVVCACLAGALHSYDREKNAAPKKAPLTRAAIAVPFLDGRPVDEAHLCNRWTFVSLPLATGAKTIVERLRVTKRRCDLMKTTPAAHAVSALNVVAAATLGPKFQSQTVYDFMSKHSMVFTNVPGPTKPVTLFRGKAVRSMTFAVSNLVNQVSVMSYAGEMGFSLVVDPDATPDAHLVGEYFARELETLIASPETTL